MIRFGETAHCQEPDSVVISSCEVGLAVFGLEPEEGWCETDD
jgi:hypothetical protein